MERFIDGRIVETKGYKKLRHAVDQVRPLQQTAILRVGSRHQNEACRSR